jgi:hypothetical protein
MRIFVIGVPARVVRTVGSAVSRPLMVTYVSFMVRPPPASSVGAAAPSLCGAATADNDELEPVDEAPTAAAPVDDAPGRRLRRRRRG